MNLKLVKLSFTLSLFFTFSSFTHVGNPQNDHQITAKKGKTEDVSLCYLKSTSLDDYMAVNVIGKCYGDPAINGLMVYVALEHNNYDLDIQQVELAQNILDVKKIKSDGKTITAIIKQEVFNPDSDIDDYSNFKVIKKKITLKVVNSEKGIFEKKVELID